MSSKIDKKPKMLELSLNSDAKKIPIEVENLLRRLGTNLEPTGYKILRILQDFLSNGSGDEGQLFKDIEDLVVDSEDFRIIDSKESFIIVRIAKEDPRLQNRIRIQKSPAEVELPSPVEAQIQAKKLDLNDNDKFKKPAPKEPEVSPKTTSQPEIPDNGPALDRYLSSYLEQFRDLEEKSE